MDDRPIGVFDSGAGGLPVLWAMAALLPSERLVYAADNANFPYGERSADAVRGLTIAAAERLIATHDIKLLVVACNTATSAALPALRQLFALPVVGIEPAVRPACALTSNGRVGVLATRGTAEGDRLAALIAREAAGVEVTVSPAPGLVEAIEGGLRQPAAIDAALSAALAPLQRANCDVVVLGCTHFAFVRQRVMAQMGAGVAVLEPAAAVARQAARVLAEHDLLALAGRGGEILYTETGNPARIEALATRLRPFLRSHGRETEFFPTLADSLRGRSPSLSGKGPGVR
jgi:glutamate racemase